MNLLFAYSQLHGTTRKRSGANSHGNWAHYGSSADGKGVCSQFDSGIFYFFIAFNIRDSSVGIETGWTARVLFPAVLDIYLLHSVQTGSEAHPASYPMGIEGKAGRGVKLTTRFHLVPRSKMVQLYLHSTIRLHGVVLN
jgi:hypothetical protein